MLSNCRQPIVILLPSVGSTAIAGSFAASPSILLPVASTLAWKLVNTPNCETLRGEVSIFRGGAGGIFFEVSSGSPSGSLRMGASVCADIVGSKTSEIRPMKEVRVKSLEYLMRGWRLKVEVVN